MIKDKATLEAAVVQEGRVLIKKNIPPEVDILISKIAEYTKSFSKDQLKMIYLTEPDKGRAVENFREIIKSIKEDEIAID